MNQRTPIGRITPHTEPQARRSRVTWFCFEFVSLLCALAFLAGLATGILATLRYVRHIEAPRPELSATVEALPLEPRVRTRSEEGLTF